MTSEYLSLFFEVLQWVLLVIGLASLSYTAAAVEQLQEIQLERYKQIMKELERNSKGRFM